MRMIFGKTIRILYYLTQLSQVKEGKKEVMMGSYDKPIPFQG